MNSFICPTCACSLARLGISSEVTEIHSHEGGMLRQARRFELGGGYR